MKIAVTSTDPLICRQMTSENGFTSAELYKAESNNHKFSPGQVCILTGLIDFPEHNGEEVVITSIREDGPKGKAYYIRGVINEAVNWIYEYRLQLKQ